MLTSLTDRRTPTDEDPELDAALRAALAPLRAVEPDEREIDDVIRRAANASTPAVPGRPPHTARRTPRPRRLGLAIAGAAAVAAVGTAVLPGSQTELASAQVVLRGAADTAAAQSPAAPVARFRYSAERVTWTYRAQVDGAAAVAAYTQVQERWLGADGQGRTRYGAVTDPRVDGPAPGWLRQIGKGQQPGSQRRILGEEARSNPLRVADLPRSTAAAGRYLDARLQSRYEGRAGGEQLRYERTRDALDLLAAGALDPSQRSALFGVLADTAGVANLGLKRDDLGRRGQAVALSFEAGTGSPHGTLQVVFDTTTAELLQWSLLSGRPDGNGGVPDQTHVVERSGWTASQRQVP